MNLPDGMYIVYSLPIGRFFTIGYSSQLNRISQYLSLLIMSSRHRFLERSINHVSLHNRLTEEEAMWSRRKQERHRSRSSHNQRKESTRKHRSSSTSSEDRNQQKRAEQQPEAEFGPPLPSNLGVNADRWDHALFMQRYPDEYDKQMKKSKRASSTSSDDEKRKKKHSQRDHHHHRRDKDEKQKKKRKRRSRSRS